MTHTDIRIRTLRPEDHDAVADIILSAYLQGGHLDPDDSYGPILADVASRAELAEILVAEVDAPADADAVDVDAAPRVAGSVVLAPPGSPLAETAVEGEYEFRMLAVHPNFHRRGIARRLLDEVIARARAEEGVHSLVLTTMETMSGAHRLYESAGFVRAPERDWMLSDEIPGIPPEEDKGPFPVYVLRLA